MPNTLNEMPDELLQVVVSNLSKSGIFNLGCTNKRLNKLARNIFQSKFQESCRVIETDLNYQPNSKNKNLIKLVKNSPNEIEWRQVLAIQPFAIAPNLGKAYLIKIANQLPKHNDGFEFMNFETNSSGAIKVKDSKWRYIDDSYIIRIDLQGNMICHDREKVEKGIFKPNFLEPERFLGRKSIYSAPGSINVTKLKS